MKKCYICRKELTVSHEKYSRLCKECGEYNLLERERIENLEGYIAIVTGGRIKIGYYTSLKLLKAGAKVIVTTRFPFDALKRYSEEEDFFNWKDRLIICELDLKRANDIEEFINFIDKNYSKIDILINNAAQTVKKNKAYYEELKEGEKKLYLEYEEKGEYKNNLKLIKNINLPTLKNEELINLEENENYNSWVAKPEDISLYEFLEVQVINSTAPFMLCTRLKKNLMSSDNLNKFIINVSSLEGSFSEKRKSSKHIHTNMAKASLNMLTKSLAKDYAKERIFIYSVDPGWVSNQFPKKWNGICDESFKAPLTFEDAASRICNPVFRYKKALKLDNIGVLFKDYKKEEW